MTGWIWVTFWGLAFAATHMLLSSVPVRRPLIRRLGEQGFQGLYSLVALATFIPFVLAWWPDRHAGPTLWMLRGVPGLRELCIGLSVLGFGLISMAVFQPSPVGIIPGGTAHGTTRITRHGAFMGLALWGIAHILMNGWAADVAFFGWLTLFAFVGSAHQDARRQALDDGTLAPFYAETSLVPFVAILSGRNKLVLGELSWLGLGVGLAVGIGLWWFHPQLFG